MRKTVLSLTLAAVLVPLFSQGAGQVHFKEIRAKAAKLERFSPEDFALGKELMKEVKKLAAKKRPAVKAPIISFEALSSAGRMWFTDHNYTDRQLFCARDIWVGGPSQFQRKSHEKTFEIFDMYGINTFSFYIYGEHAQRYYESLAALKSNLKVIPTVTPPGFNGKLNPQRMKMIANSPYTLRLNGKIVYLCWGQLDIPKTKEYIKYLEKLTNNQAAYIHSCGTIYSYADPWNSYVIEKRVSAKVILYWFDYLTKVLKYAQGIEFSNRLTEKSGNLCTQYYYDVIMPLFAAVCAQEEFNGKKLFGFQILTGYNNYRGRQRLSAEGTLTLRDYLKICKDFNVDIVKAFEWDEYNEDSHFQPTVNKPMAYQRILKYWNDTNNKRKLSGNPGDDMTLPNLIVSHRKHIVPGLDYRLELLHVPDSEKSAKYTVKAEILNEKDDVVFCKDFTFDRAKFMDHTIMLPPEKYISSKVLITRLTIDYLGKKRVIQEGLPCTVVRPTTICDSTWYSTPLRNVLFPKNADIEFGKKFNPAGALPERINIPVKGDLLFADKLNSLEIVQNGRDTRFSYDPFNEYRQNDPDRVNLILSFYQLEIPNWKRDKFTASVSIKNAPSALRFVHPSDKRYKYLRNVSVKADELPFTEPYTTTITPSSWRAAHYFSIAKADFDKAVFSIKGEVVAGENKGMKFSWELPVAELKKAGVCNKIFANGIQFALEIPQRMDRLPLPINDVKAKFATTLHTGYPDGVFAVRAVSRNGKVYWSKPHIVERSEKGFFSRTFSSPKQSVVSAFHDDKGTFDVKVDSDRVPHVKYRFDPAYAGNILTTSAGREFYANIGGYDLVPTGYEGYHCSIYSIPYSFYKFRDKKTSKFVPAYEKLADGSYCLKFTGNGEFIGFPPSLFPQRTGCTVKFEFMPEDVESDQVYFVHAEHDIAGFRLRTENGRLVADFYRRQMPKNMPGKTVLTTNLEPVEGKWNTLVFKYDLNKLSITLNGKTEVIPCQGLSRWFAVAGFGGDGTKSVNHNKHYFKGKLKSFEVIHSAN